MDLPEPIPSAPPTVPGQLNEGVRSTWPTVIGTISIVFGALGVLFSLCGAFGQMFMGSMMQGVGGQNTQTQQMADAIKAAAPYQLIAAILTLIPAVLLLISGIGLVQRRRYGARLSITWAVLRMVFGLAAAFVNVRAQQIIMQQVSSSGGPTPPSGMMLFTGLFGLVFGIAWAWAYPIFILIWLNRRVIKQETATWP
jgi:hypothetical protein